MEDEVEVEVEEEVEEDDDEELDAMGIILKSEPERGIKVVEEVEVEVEVEEVEKGREKLLSISNGAMTIMPLSTNSSARD